MNNRTIHFACILLVGVALCISCSKLPQERAVALYKNAIKQLGAFDFAGASQTLDKIAVINPAHPLIGAGKGMQMEQQLLTVDAFDFYANVRELAPDLPEGYEGIYRIQKRLGMFDDALSTIDGFGKVAPKNPEAISLLAEAVLNAGLPQLASRIIDSAVHVGLTEPEADFLRARAWYLQRNTDSASFYAAAALKDKADSPRFNEVAADYYETIGFADSAMLFSAMEMESAGKTPVTWIHHFDRALRLGYFAAAREIERQIAVQATDSVLTFGMKTDYFNATNRFVEASNQSIYLSGIVPQSNLTRPLHELRARSGMDDQNQVADILAGVSNPLDRGVMNEVTRQFLIAFFYITFAGEAFPIDAVTYIDKVYGPDISRRDFRTQQVFVYYSSGAFNRFDSVLALIDTHFGDLSDWQASLGDIFIASGPSHYDQAKERYEKALSLNPNYLPGFMGYLNATESVAKYTDAEQLFERFPQFAAWNPEVALRRAAVLAINGKRTEAMPIFEAAIRHRSGDIRAINRFMDALSRRSDSEGEDQALAILAKIAPDNPDIISLLADQAIEKGNFADGLEITEKGIKADPDFAVLYAQKARALYGLNRQDEAFKLLDSLYEPNQCDPDFVYNYARLLSQNGINLDKAANLSRGAVMYSNYQYQKYLQLIDTYCLMKRYDLAWTDASNLALAYPTRPEGLYRTAIVGKELGKPGMKELLERSIANGLGGTDLENARKVLPNFTN